jgi:multicomponent Na+:H+ antiporter subunit D
MPVAGTTSVIAALSAAGVPPLSGFWSKLMIIVALMQADRPGYAAVALLASVLTLGYMLVIQRGIFFSKVSEGFAGLKETSRGLIVLQVFLASLILAAGIAFGFVYNNFLTPVQNILF